ncbi:MAG TPA: hypothetical protein VFM46_03045, partial [Pseudomonadales bacterium]|nr:hypothetical protein [Pseudomonadales bacterium]
HHYKSRDAVVEAAAKFLIEKRATEFDKLIGHVEVPAGALPTLENMKQAVSILQKYYQLPSFVALHELLRGARSEENLKAVLVPLERELDKRISASILRHFPFWAEIDETREVLMDMVTFCMQGMAVDMAPYLAGERLQYLCDLLAETAMREFTRAYEGKAKKKRK